jgi:hypothetical protein
MYSVDVNVFVLTDPNQELYDEVPMEVVFDIEDNSGLIEAYLIDGKNTNIDQIRQHNPLLDKHVDYAIGKFIINHENESEELKKWERE